MCHVGAALVFSRPSTAMPARSSTPSRRRSPGAHGHESGETMMANGARRGAVVVTGASKGIGRACALRLDRQGFRVFAGVRREADAEALRQDASARLEPVLVAVTDQAAVTALGEHVARAVGDSGLAGLVNNAGIAVAGPLEFLPPDELRRQLDVNVTGQLAVTQALLPALRLARGRIVNIGSISGRL